MACPGLAQVWTQVKWVFVFSSVRLAGWQTWRKLCADCSISLSLSLVAGPPAFRPLHLKVSRLASRASASASASAHLLQTSCRACSSSFSASTTTTTTTNTTSTSHYQLLHVCIIHSTLLLPFSSTTTYYYSSSSYSLLPSPPSLSTPTSPFSFSINLFPLLTLLTLHSPLNTNQPTH